MNREMVLLTVSTGKGPLVQAHPGVTVEPAEGLAGQDGQGGRPFIPPPQEPGEAPKKHQKDQQGQGGVAQGGDVHGV